MLYNTANEVEEILNNERAVVLNDGGKLVGFLLWNQYGDWLEIHTIYITPEFRGQGHFVRLQQAAQEKILKKSPKYVFMFTRIPAVASLWGRFGFVRSSYGGLPFRIWLVILKRRLAIKRLPSYLKHGFNIIKAATSGLYILEIKNPGSNRG